MTNEINPITEPYQFNEGSIPLLISFPHVGTRLTDAVANGLTPAARELPDTDWHVDRLYRPIAERLGASTITAKYSRYVVDLNRPPNDAALYDTKTPGLFPENLFCEEPIFQADKTPSQAERQQYLTEIWQPYHQQITQTLEAMRQQFGYAILYDAHSIASVVPSLFEGRLPDLNIGTNAGESASKGLEQQVIAACQLAQPDYDFVCNGRFRGGYITREYGKPQQDIHAIQMELSQATYMQESAPYDYQPDKAERIQPVLAAVIENVVDWAASNLRHLR